MISEDDDLSLVPTPRLAEELARRFSNFVMLGQRDLNTEGDSETGDYISGSYYACLGLVASKYAEMILGDQNNE